METKIETHLNSTVYNMQFFTTDCVELTDWFMSRPVSEHVWLPDEQLNEMVTLKVRASEVPHLEGGKTYVVV